jgi:GNAT superfamily N-acetyltransferase
LLTGLPAAQQATFAGFAAAMAGDGFAFLHQRLQSGRARPVMVTVTGGHVSGAIGPLETSPDAAGNAQLMPQYFGVLPQMRGQGLGRALWRAAMRWGREHGAAYQLLQTTAGGPSDRLCQAEGLTSLGYVSRVPA